MATDEWLSGGEFTREHNCSRSSLSQWLKKGKVESRKTDGKGKRLQYRIKSVDAINKSFLNGGQYQHTAWLAEKCFKEDTSFSVELNKIIGEYRERLQNTNQ